jgi:hypothetical protein
VSATDLQPLVVEGKAPVEFVQVVLDELCEEYRTRAGQ